MAFLAYETVDRILVYSYRRDVFLSPLVSFFLAITTDIQYATQYNSKAARMFFFVFFIVRTRASYIRLILFDPFLTTKS